MSALDYLKTLPVVVINVPTSTRRWGQFCSMSLPLFGEAVRFPASPILDARAEALEWRDMVRYSVQGGGDPLGLFNREGAFLALDKTLEREQKQREYAATYSLFRTTIQVCQFALSQGWERFAIAEDDAVPRLDVLDALGAPPPGSEMTIWGGAISGGAHKWDSREYLSGKQGRYVRIKQPKGLYNATLYEMNLRAASLQIEKLMAHPHGIDCSWWYTMRELEECWRIFPTAFVQYGQSDRIKRPRFDAYTRETR